MKQHLERIIASIKSRLDLMGKKERSKKSGQEKYKKSAAYLRKGPKKK